MVGAVRQVEPLLFSIGGEGNYERRPGGEGARLDDLLCDKLATLLEDLDPVPSSVGDIDQPIVRASQPVDRGELLGR